MASYKLKRKLAKRKNYGSKRSTKSIGFIVLHFTANDGDTDEANGNYFANNLVYASAHYFVDDDSVTQSVPDNYAAYSVGGSKYSDCSKTGGGKYYGKCTNANSISIEICDDVKNGKIYPSAKTIANAVALTKDLMKKYNIPASRVIRHFDVNGKKCPAYWCGSDAKNKKWQTEFHDKLKAKKEEVYKMDVLKKGSTGNDVTIFETIMKKMGYYKGNIDTSFGPKCVEACNAFQERYPECGKNGKPDGVFGAKSWKKALSLLEA